jgi:hypothetical protein
MWEEIKENFVYVNQRGQYEASTPRKYAWVMK